jgi:hypothetical protein
MTLPLLVLSALAPLSPSTAVQCEVEAFVQPFGAGTAGTHGVPELRGVGGPLTGTVYHMQVLRGRPSAPGLVLGGLTEVDVFLPSFGGALYVGSPYLAQAFTLDADGDSPPLLQLKIEPMLCGLVAVAQAAVFDPTAAGGAALTQALRVGFGVAQGPLLPAAEYPTGESPHSVVSLDLDGDGALDLAATCHVSGELATMLGRGDGTFAPAALAQVGDHPAALATGDVNGNGFPDLVAVNWESDDVSVVFGSGDGTLGAALQIGLGDHPIGLALGDLDLDGSLDLAVASNQSDELVLLFGTVSGMLVPEATLPVGDSPRSTAITDVDLDGLQDLLFVDGDGLSVRLGLGDGVLAPALLYADSALDLCFAADLDVDGDPDVALLRKYTDDVDLLQGQGDGTFLPLPSLKPNKKPSSVAVADLDADGWADLVVPNYFPDDASVFLGTGGGLFVESLVAVDVAGGPQGVATGDFDADGHQDFVTAASGNDSLSVRLGLGDGTFQVPPLVQKSGLGAGELVISDLNDDGASDFVVLNGFGSKAIDVILGQGDGSFAAAVELELGGLPRSVVVEDFTGDGHPDPCVSGSSFVTKLFPGRGDGTFGNPLAVPGIGYPLETADLDGDGDLDLVSPAASGFTTSLNAGHGMFPTFAYQPLLAATPDGLTLGDFDGDGAPDLAGRIKLTDQAPVLLGLGDGTFGPAVLLATGNAPEDVETADLDLDGDLDLALVRSGPAAVDVLLGSGDGTFAAPATFNLKPDFYCDYLALGDLDVDGIPDAVASPIIEVAVLRGLGDGAFQPALYFAGNVTSGGFVGEPAIGDLDGDGLPDIAASNHSFGVVLFKNLLLE